MKIKRKGVFKINLKNKVKARLNQEHFGFAITFEVMASLFMLAIFMSLTLYILRVVNTQRFMNTVLTSTATIASKWGGWNTEDYQITTGSDKNILLKAQEYLNLVAGDFNPEISSPLEDQRISYSNNIINMGITYQLPPVFSDMSNVFSSNGSYNMYNDNRNLSMEINIKSIKYPGALLK